MCKNLREEQPRSRQKGSNQVAMRSYNEKLVLELIRAHGTLTKADATRATGLSPNAISMIFRALEQENLILRNEPISRAMRGRPAESRADPVDNCSAGKTFVPCVVAGPRRFASSGHGLCAAPPHIRGHGHEGL